MVAGRLDEVTYRPESFINNCLELVEKRLLVEDGLAFTGSG
jgi:hypothetical protein